MINKLATKYEVTIGLEVHVQLATKSKIFSGSATSFGADPNSNASIIDLGFPGVLPVLNKEAVRMALAFGLAINAQIDPVTEFARKNYFYPDLPKSYQISQHDKPIVGKGAVEISVNGQKKKIGVTRAHLEEDAGKSIHDLYPEYSAIDLNRAGTPLLEIVSEPELHSAEEAVAYLKVIHSLVRYLEISDGNMAEGSMRCDANVSIAPTGSNKLGTRAEIKNINSFRFVEKAIEHEIQRQIEILESGEKVVQETRLYDSVKNETRSMRSKEDAMDYRYFPDPDLPPFKISIDEINAVKFSLPELPSVKVQRFIKMGLSETDALILAEERSLALFFEEALTIGKDIKLAFSWVTVELLGFLNKTNIDIKNSPLTSSHIGDLIARIKEGIISGKIAKTIFAYLSENPNKSVDEVIEEKGLKQVSDTGAIEDAVKSVLNASAKQVEEYKLAEEHKKPRMLGFFVGQVMKATAGKANPAQVNEVLSKLLNG